ncbi:ATP-binding cassette domain-containing protein [Haloimpatiens sp. FM7315]|uniref:ATP-binding cassette domain-containing protein n=1 Tax=Haloimpatiens sp. FM7315 TaxID=3298609 RepID=UPI00370AF142
MNIIDIKDLSKEYIYKKNINKALNKVSMQINEGEIVGLVGPNGAGKSTLIKLICGILMKTSGEISIMGKDPFKGRKKVCYDLAVMFGQRTSLWYNIPVKESLYLVRDIYSIPKHDFKIRLDKYSKVLNVSDLLDIPVRKLSFGQKIKCELLSIILHNPKLIILDEPTIGLDILSKQSLRNILYDFAHENKATILITSHDLDDIQKICNRIVFINKGKFQLNLKRNDLDNILIKTAVIYVDKNDENGELVKSKFYRDKSESSFKFVMPATEVQNFTLNLYKFDNNTNFRKESPGLEDILYEYYK